MVRYVIGINGVQASSHDSSAALLAVDSDNTASVLICSEEERYIRKKRAIDTFPTQAINHCLLMVNDISKITDITWGWKTTRERTVEDFLQIPPKDTRYQHIHTSPIPHHEAHAASVFYMSPFIESAIIVVDGQGETESATIWSANRQDGLKKLHSVGIDRSLGFMYASIAEWCGLGGYGSGKLMGLAPYGTPVYRDKLEAIFSNIKIGPTPLGSYELYRDSFFAELKKYGFTIKKRPSINRLPNKIYRDLAASAQEMLIDKMLELSSLAQELTKSQNLCLAGGVAMNCVANSRIYEQHSFVQMFIQPGCEDNGASLGAALAVAKPNRVVSQLPYLGEEFTNKQIENELKKYPNLGYYRHNKPWVAAASLLADNNIVGWFQGRSEFGPRALGNRSILANPSAQGMHRKINTVKSREQWRPFGPSVVLEKGADIFDKFHESPYMLFSFTVRDEWKQKLKAITHIDGSTRPQTVAQTDNKRYYDLLIEFEKQTGIPAVLNTSFNGNGEPIVNSPKDAVACFNKLGLDALVIGDYVVSTKQLEKK